MDKTTPKNTYLPDYVVHPGKHVQEAMDTFGLIPADIAQMGVPLETINEILAGKGSITHDLTFVLEKALRRPARFWARLQVGYNEDLVRLVRREEPLRATARNGSGDQNADQ